MQSLILCSISSSASLIFIKRLILLKWWNDAERFQTVIMENFSYYVFFHQFWIIFYIFIFKISVYSFYYSTRYTYLFIFKIRCISNTCVCVCSCCLAGRAYPLGDVPEDIVVQVKHQVCRSCEAGLSLYIIYNVFEYDQQSWGHVICLWGARSVIRHVTASITAQCLNKSMFVD